MSTQAATRIPIKVTLNASTKCNKTLKLYTSAFFFQLFLEIDKSLMFGVFKLINH